MEVVFDQIVFKLRHIIKQMLDYVKLYHNLEWKLFREEDYFCFNPGTANDV